MPKKKNKKFKANKAVNQPTIQSIKDSSTQTTTLNPENPLVNAKIETVKPDEITLLNEKYAFVRRDVKKLLLTLGVLAVLFVGFYFLSTKTNTLVSVGNWIYKVGNIQIQ